MITATIAWRPSDWEDSPRGWLPEEWADAQRISRPAPSAATRRSRLSPQIAGDSRFTLGR